MDRGGRAGAGARRVDRVVAGRVPERPRLARLHGRPAALPDPAVRLGAVGRAAPRREEGDGHPLALRVGPPGSAHAVRERALPHPAARALPRRDVRGALDARRLVPGRQPHRGSREAAGRPLRDRAGDRVAVPPGEAEPLRARDRAAGRRTSPCPRARSRRTRGCRSRRRRGRTSRRARSRPTSPRPASGARTARPSGRCRRRCTRSSRSIPADDGALDRDGRAATSARTRATPGGAIKALHD